MGSVARDLIEHTWYLFELWDKKLQTLAQYTDKELPSSRDDKHYIVRTG